uniref:Uncharacterized protein n=1 Tax=Cannabis sativa TaxID=3483 RepID=A0A803NJZ5_CANSA
MASKDQYHPNPRNEPIFPPTKDEPVCSPTQARVEEIPQTALPNNNLLQLNLRLIPYLHSLRIISLDLPQAMWDCIAYPVFPLADHGTTGCHNHRFGITFNGNQTNIDANTSTFQMHRRFFYQKPPTHLHQILEELGTWTVEQVIISF